MAVAVEFETCASSPVSGDRDYIFKFLPPFLSGGTYIGSRTWPQAGTWTIEYKAPTILYVWAEKGQYNAGVDDALSADGWGREEEGQFMRWNSRGNNPLCIWSRHFQTGSSYSSLVGLYFYLGFSRWETHGHFSMTA